jgi:hypothetical protein
MSEESRRLRPPDSCDDRRGPASRGTAQRQDIVAVEGQLVLRRPGVFSAHQFRAFRGETLKLVKLAIMDFEATDALKFAHCSYLKTLDI